MHDTLNRIAEAGGLGCPFEAGRLEASTVVCESAKDALASFAKFDGDGWLCTESEVRRVRSGEMPAGDWPVAGERVSARDPSESLHLRQAGAQWLLTTLRRVESGPGVIVRARHLASDARNGALEYEVGYEPCDLGGHHEMRPVAFRFAGFGEGGD